MGWTHHDHSSLIGGPAVSRLSLAPEGGWTWFTDPRAVDFNGHTYFGYVKGSNGDIVARSYDHAAGTLSAETILHAALDVDDHANPSFLVRASDRKILAFYTAHNDSAGIRIRLSTSAEDVSAFDAESVVDVGGENYDYASPHQLTGEANDPIYLFFRDSKFTATAHRNLAYTKSTDDGANWSAHTDLLEGGGRIPYWKHVSSGGDRIDFAVSDGHPYEDGANDLLHFYYQGGQWFTTDGTEITSPPFAFSELTEVWTTGKSWVHDVAMGLDGHPRIVFAYFPTDNDHRYYYARWTGSAWETNEIVAAGDTITPTEAASVHYSGGIVLDHQDPRVVYASVEVGSTWEMRRYMTDDGGETFHVTSLTSGSSVKNIRPAPVMGHHSGPLSLLWMAGTYTMSRDYSVGTYESDTVLPHTEAGSGSGLTIEDEGSALATAATTLDFVGAGVTASGTGAEKTITIPGATEGSGEILISDTPSTPLVFGDLIQNEDQDDLVYAD